MKNSLKRLMVFLCLFTLTVSFAQAQTHTISHYINYASYQQNMWGPNGSPFSMDTNINLFHFNPHDTVQFGYIENILGGQFGAALDIGYWLEIGSTFAIHGFHTGKVDVEYPVKIDLTFPDDSTFNPGQTITIESEYDVMPGWNLESYFPNTGEISLDLDFGFGIDVDAQVCVWGCATVPVLHVGVPTDSIVLLHLTNNNGSVSAYYPCLQGNQLTFCNDTIIPIVFTNLGGFGLSGTISIPFVETNDYLGQDKCLYAYGDSAYLWFDLDIIQFLIAVSGPSSGLGQALSQLQGTISLGAGISVDYNLLTAHLLLTNTMNQDFTFCPTLWTHMDFDQAFNYTVTNPLNNNVVVDSGFNDTIVWQVDYDLNLQLPCAGVDSIPIGMMHSMDNDFTNHTWDSIAFSFAITAFTFTLNLPSFPIAPSSAIPPFCVNVPAAKGGIVCSPKINTPLTGSPKVSYTIGPLVDLSIPLGYIPLTWFNQTWELDGFYDSIFPGMVMYPNPPMSSGIAGNNVICYGDSTAVVVVNVNYGTPPFTFEWSNGINNVSSNPYDSIYGITAGTYSVTITDQNGCSSAESLTAVQNPEILLSFQSNDVYCQGDSTGSIYATASGGTPPFYYMWSNSETTSSIQNLPAGEYTLTVTDDNGCTKVLTDTLIELNPLPFVNISSDIIEGCEPLTVQFYETNIDSLVYLWNFHDGFFDTWKNPVHTFQYSGTYDISLTVTSLAGCDSTLTIPQMITVYPLPVPGAYATPTVIRSSEDPSYTVQFTDQSNGAVGWLWNFDDPASSSNTSAIPNPQHSFTDEGVYTVWLTVISVHGCVDSIPVEVEMIDDILTIPNVFTPNGDGFNDYFEIENIEKFPGTESKLVIYNRWGSKVFETYGYNNRWDGGNLADGVYFFVLEYGPKFVKKVEGTITIQR